MVFARILLIALLLCSTWQNVWAHDVRIAMSEWTPYTSDTLPQGGVLADVVREAYARVGLEASFDVLPWERVALGLSSGKYDAALAVYSTERSRNKYYLSPDILSTQLVFAKLRTRKLQGNTLGQLAGCTFGVVKASSYRNKLARHGIFTVEVAPHEKQNVRKLLAGRVDVILDVRHTLEHVLEYFPLAERRQIEVIQPPFEEKSMHAAFAKNSQGAALQVKLAEGLSLLRKDGSYDAILKRHGFLFEH